MAGFEATLCQVSQVNNVTAGLATVPTVLLASQNRSGFILQNLGTNPLFVYFGTGATFTNYHAVLQAGTTQADGKGGVLAQISGLTYQGIVSAVGTGATYCIADF